MNYKNLYLNLSLLNKYLFSIDIFGHLEIPDIYLLVHPICSIFGRAKYNSLFVVYQGVTIGRVHNTSSIDYPLIGKDVVCYSSSKLLGKTIIEDNVIIGANTLLINEFIESNCTVVGSKPNTRQLPLFSSSKEIFFYNLVI